MSKEVKGILRVFLNVDMRNGHDGLSKTAKENGIKTSDIEAGSYVIFINASSNKLKMYAAGEVIAYLRLPAGRKINMDVIRELPRVFDGRRINYQEALKTAVEAALVRKGKATYIV